MSVTSHCCTGIGARQGKAVTSWPMGRRDDKACLERRDEPRVGAEHIEDEVCPLVHPGHIQIDHRLPLRA
jgi:hypothetical protein